MIPDFCKKSQMTFYSVFRERGVMYVEGGDTASLTNYRDVLTRQGAPFKFIQSNEELRSQFPMFNFPPDSKAILDPSAGILYANKCVKVLQVGFAYSI